MSTGIITKVEQTIAKNAPTILACLGAIGTGAAVVMSSKAALESKKIIEEESAKRELSKPDKAVIYIKAYAPTAAMTAASMVCIFGSNHINKQRIAGLASAYILSETTLKEYKDKAEEIVGSKKAQEIKDSVIQKHIQDNPPTELNTVENRLGVDPTRLSLWFDETSRRYFYTNADYIRRAETEANKMLQKNGFVSVNDVYDLLGLEPIMLGHDLGWSSSEQGDVRIEIGAALVGPDIPVGTITMDVTPCSSWIAEV